ncbi:hypothetical protein COT95_02455 [Candidatus Falkowbacteria bacterium CG10_big_fil_rev_8_21_14_0_10_37_6]|uniref:DUF4258 domain-containing protein n=1 Tax=Candidatus Falkowbacteria bacterium CG10_big_fil_rev_8_21_14_0_10_37_6 TaxID=1974563 RepID=A0A2H0V6M3_9BACT|nr:MAG: hypothetical protein COT95_02455 [Candidatus Falkowbacteria bacterium CG10_big_fil_rev_8_21_14_0_10_37_6]
MLHFSNYAGQKFDLLNKYKVFITKEQVEEAVRLSETTRQKEGYVFYKKADLTVVVKKINEISTIVTFFPS